MSGASRPLYRFCISFLQNLIRAHIFNIRTVYPYMVDTFVLWTQKRAPNRTPSRLGRFEERKRTTNQFSAVSPSSFRCPIWEQTEGEFRKAVGTGIEAGSDQVCLPPKLQQHSLGLHRRNNNQNQQVQGHRQKNRKTQEKRAPPNRNTKLGIMTHPLYFMPARAFGFR